MTTDGPGGGGLYRRGLSYLIRTDGLTPLNFTQDTSHRQEKGTAIQGKGKIALGIKNVVIWLDL